MKTIRESEEDGVVDENTIQTGVLCFFDAHCSELKDSRMKMRYFEILQSAR